MLHSDLLVEIAHVRFDVRYLEQSFEMDIYRCKSVSLEIPSIEQARKTSLLQT